MGHKRNGPIHWTLHETTTNSLRSAKSFVCGLTSLSLHGSNTLTNKNQPGCCTYLPGADASYTTTTCNIQQCTNPSRWKSCQSGHQRMIVPTSSDDPEWEVLPAASTFLVKCYPAVVGAK